MGWHVFFPRRTAFCWSGPLLALVVTGFGIGIVISSSSKWRKMFSCCPIQEDDGYKKEDKIGQLAGRGKKGKEDRISQLPTGGVEKEEEDRISQLSDGDKKEENRISQLPDTDGGEKEEEDSKKEENRISQLPAADGGKRIEEDRISQLPNDLLSEILSRLRLPEAVRTSILARRWRNIWAQRSNLVLSCAYLCGGMIPHQIPKMHRFMNAVDQTLRFTSSHKIKYAHIRCCFAKEIFSDFSRWVQHLISSGATELFFSFFCPSDCFVRNSFAFPFDLLFQAASLKHLRLFYCSLKPSFEGHFQSLEHLELFTVQLHNGEIPNILSSCVNLQRLVLRNCKLPTDLYISCLSLKFLEMDTCFGVRMIDIKAVNLTTFICFSFDNIEYKLSCVPKLEQMSVRYRGAGVVPYIFGEIAGCCPEIKTMLCQTWIEKITSPTCEDKFAAQTCTVRIADVLWIPC